MKNEISIRGEFEEYEDDLEDLDGGGIAGPNIIDNGRSIDRAALSVPRDGMRLL